ncbi:MAG TPA: type II toxin-antitoxin system death-on-curing family toxin [Pyrinomonadaceae bacterium]|nr:type II toxin-antitoxin system death-on-curing family toxin [Pyrinomonadaceae bacterium]
MTEPEFLTLEDVLLIHDEQLEAYGGIRDEGLLESAVMTAQASFGGEYLHQDLFEMAAAYAFHIAENQPFLDGNKRTALVSALVFLDFNGFEILDVEMKLYDAMIAIANKEMDKYDLAELLKTLSEQ